MMIESKDRYVIVNGKAYDVVNGSAEVPIEEINAERKKLGLKPIKEESKEAPPIDPPEGETDPEQK